MNTWYDSSVNSNILRKTYVNGFLDVSQNVSVRNKLFVTGDTSLNSDLYVDGEIHANDIYRMGGHILPTSNANYDIGSAEYKVRHLFLSDNSLWVGDNHKIDVDGGKLKFRKRDVSKIPKALIEKGTDLEQIKGVLGIPELTIENISLGQYLDYARISGLDFQGRTGELISLEDIYTKDIEDYEDIQDAEITNEDLSLNYNLYANGDVSFNSKMFVKGDVSFNSRVDVIGEFRAQYPDDSIPISAIIGDNENKADKDLVDASFNLKADLTYVDASFNLKADLTYVDASFNLKANMEDTNDAIALKADLTYVDASLNLKADINNPEFTGDVSMNANVDIGGNLNVKLNSGGNGTGTIRTGRVQLFNSGLSIGTQTSQLAINSNNVNGIGFYNRNSASDSNISESMVIKTGGDVSMNGNLVIGGDLSLNGNLAVVNQSNITIITFHFNITP